MLTQAQTATSAGITTTSSHLLSLAYRNYFQFFRQSIQQKSNKLGRVDLDAGAHR